MKTTIAQARRAQSEWAKVRLPERLAFLRRLRSGLAEHASELARLAAQPNERPVVEKLVSEVVPLLDACRFLERAARRVLRRQRFGARGRPLWLLGSSFTVERKPLGVVLIVGPRNYPLFLPAVQLLQALVAGNAVLLKPAENCSAPLRWMTDRLCDSGVLPDDLVQLLPEAPAAAQEAVRVGVDKVIFTGASESGRQLLELMAARNTPGVFELSGADAVVVRQDADLERTARAIAFGRELNGGQTCMAPQFVLVHPSRAASLTSRLEQLSVTGLETIICPDDGAALAWAEQSEFGLGASIFSADGAAAHELARQWPSGFVTINDLIVPTADPRLPFGGLRSSGFGITRGAEGLLEMTSAHVIAVRRGRWLPHLQPAQSGDEELFAAYIKLAHQQGTSRLAGLRELWRAARRRGKEAGVSPVRRIETGRPYTAATSTVRS